MEDKALEAENRVEGEGRALEAKAVTRRPVSAMGAKVEDKVKVEDKGLEGRTVVTRRPVSATGAKVEAKVEVEEAKDNALEAKAVASRWVSVTGKDAGLTVGTDLIGLNMVITEDLAVGKAIHNGNRSVITNMLKGK